MIKVISLITVVILQLVHSNLGVVYKETNQLEKAYELFKEAVKIIVKDFGEDHVLFSSHL